MTGLYLLSIKEYASAKTAAVTPEPHVKAISFSIDIHLLILELPINNKALFEYFS